MTDTQAGTPAQVQAVARETYRQSVAAEMPLSGEALGRMYGRSGRWGRDRISEVRAEEAQPLPVAGLPVSGGGSGNGQVSEAVAGLSPGVAAQGLPVADVVAATRAPVAGAAASRRANGKGYALTALLTGIGVSIAGNVMSAQKSTDVPAAWVVAAFWPVAVYLAIEVITRVSWPAGFWPAVARFAGAGTVGAVAALVSYRHMAHLMTTWGETGVSVTLGPLAVDGLVVVAATALYAIHRKEEQK